MTSINEANKPGNEFSGELGIEMGKKGAKQEYAYEYIKRAIVENRFAPEQCLNEKDLGIELGGLSRTPIRDALRKLVYEGMIDYVPGKGMFVSEIRFEDLLEVSEIRIPLEKTCVELFIERANQEEMEKLEELYVKHREAYEAGDLNMAIRYDDEFHRRIAEGTYNSRLSAYVDSLIDQNSRGAYLTAEDPQRVETSLGEHELILKTIRAKDKQTAVQLMEQHLTGWTSYVMTMQLKRFYFRKKG